jgi:tetratricopeptide (TPR) repeat protein
VTGEGTASEHDEPQWHALLASRLKGFKDLRARIWELGQAGGTPVWVSEIDAAARFAEKDLDFIQMACIRQVRSAPKFICLLDGSFGTALEKSEISILELELATAAFSKRDIWIFLLAPFERPDPRLVSLLSAISTSCPSARIKGPLSQEKVIAEIARLLDETKADPQTLKVGPLVQDLARKRSPALNFDLARRDVRFLNGGFAPLFDRPPDKDVIDRLIAQSDAEAILPDKLARLWIAIRHLSAAPFTDKRYADYLPLWESALKKWESASGWYALHGHFFLGRLAAINSLSVIRERMQAAMPGDAAKASPFAYAGGAASEYYSIAKLVPSQWQKFGILRKALWNCNAALSERSPNDASGTLSVRGHVKLRMLNVPGGLSDLKKVLAIRQEQGDSIGRIGEAEAHLGRAYVLCRQFGKAERLLHEGIDKLRAADNVNFLVQALRHLAALYVRTGRRAEAIAVLREAQRIARAREIQGQLGQIEAELKRLGEDL